MSDENRNPTIEEMQDSVSSEVPELLMNMQVQSEASQGAQTQSANYEALLATVERLENENRLLRKAQNTPVEAVKAQLQDQAQSAVNEQVETLRKEAVQEVDLAASQKAGFRNISLKLDKPEKYNGARTEDAVDNFVKEMRSFLLYQYETGSRLTQEAQLLFIGHCLTGQAKSAWETRQRLKDHGHNTAVKTVDECFHWLQVTFRPFDYKEKRQERYVKCKQTNSVADYAYELLDLADKLEHRPHDDDIKFQFKQGLKDSVKTQLALAAYQPTELIPFIEFVAELDKQYYNAKVNLNKSRRAGYESGGRAIANPNSVNYGNSRFSGGERVTAVVNKSLVPSKGTYQWKEYCRNERRCFTCGSQEHSARDCPQNGNRNTVKQQMNMIEDRKAGKATGPQ